VVPVGHISKINAQLATISRNRHGVKLDRAALIINTHHVLIVKNSQILMSVRSLTILFPKSSALSSNLTEQHVSSKFVKWESKDMLRIWLNIGVNQSKGESEVKKWLKQNGKYLLWVNASII
jgi:hypothetical protein